jgi:hypothetical protein
MYARAFFDLQLRFAHRVALVSGMPLARALLEYTNLYIRFGLGRDFDAAHPTWREYVAGLQDSNDRREWTYRFYTRRSEVPTVPGVVATFGCFSYARTSADRIRLHFLNADTDGQSPLGADRAGQRRAELARLFRHVKQTLPRSPQVVGASWLYNLHAYRRLFPVSYVASARLLERRFQHMPLWGQFVDRHGDTREDVTREFLSRLESHTSVDGLDDCFPFQVLTATAPVAALYDFYGA